MKPMRLWLLLPLGAVACASTGPSRELVDARHAYEALRSTPAARYRPDRVLDARQALARAERAHQDDPGSFEEKNLAYVAARRSELALVYGNYAIDQHNAELANQAYREREARLRDTESRTAQTPGEPEDAREWLGGTTGSSDEATRRAAAALASLHAVAKVREDSRGTVITLADSSLFASGSDTLSAEGRGRLDEVARALKDTDPNRTIEIEGYAGSDASRGAQRVRARADAVRTYLIRQGVDGTRIRAASQGAPAGTNDAARTRARGQCVEILVGNAAPASAPTPSEPHAPPDAPAREP